MRLSKDVEAALSFQAYPPDPSIEGVALVPLRKHRAGNGWFMEYLRITGGRTESALGGFELRQISVSYATAGRINAFHIHPKLAQSELWSVIQGQLLVWLVDCREESPTRSVKRKIILSGEEPTLLSVPAGVAHGYKAGSEGGLLLYSTGQHFDPQDPNEGRLSWDYFGSGLWEDDRG